MAPQKTVATGFDAILDSRVGSFGKGQLLLLIIASLSHIVMAVLLMTMVFTSLNPITSGTWECLQPTTTSQQPGYAACLQLWQSTHMTSLVPNSTAVATSLAAGLNASTAGTTDPPAAPLEGAALITAFCALPPGTTRWTHPGNSLLSTYDLACGGAWLVNLLNSMYFVGLAVGGTIFGALSDRYGRRTCIYGCTALAAVASTGEALAPTFWLHAACRVVGAAAIQGMAIADVVLVTELVGPDYRGRVGILTQSFFIAGECLVALLAYLVPNWRALTLMCAALAAAFVLTAPLVPESPRWLAAARRNKKAARVMAKLARQNGFGGPGLDRASSGALGIAGYGRMARERWEEAEAAEIERLLEQVGAQRDEGVPDGERETVQLLGAAQGGWAGEEGAAADVECGKGGAEAVGEGGKGAGCAVEPPRAVRVKAAGGLLRATGGSGDEEDVDSAYGRTGGADAGAHAVQPGSSRGSLSELEEAHVGARDSAVAQPLCAAGGLSLGQPTGAAPAAPKAPTSVAVDAGPLPAAVRHTYRPSGHHPLPRAPSRPHPSAQRPYHASAPTVGQALRNRLVLTYVAVTSLALCTLVLAYYGIGFALSYIPGSLYFSFFLISIAEAPSSLVVGLLIDRLGRCALVLAGMLVSGLACIACGLAEGAPVVQVLFAMLGKFGCSGAWSVLVVYCAEVFPTSVRSVLAGAIFQSARVGGVAAPFVFLLGSATGWLELPFWLMGLSTLATGALCVLLPETCGDQQPESLEDLQRHSGRTTIAYLAAHCGRRRAAAAAPGDREGSGAGKERAAEA